MNTLKITVNCDRKAALLTGLILGETAEVEVSQETIGSEWPALVGLLDMSAVQPRAREITVAVPTAEAVKAWLEAQSEARAAKERENQERLTSMGVEAERFADAEEAILLAPMTPSRKYASNAQVSQHGLPTCAMYDGFDRETTHYSTYDPKTERAKAACARITAARRANSVALDAANAAAFESALPALLAAKAEAEEKARLAEIAKKEANAIKFAARLASGQWTKETGSYNEKRYGAWWVARVDFASGAKGDYTFGESSGNWGKASELSVDCRPGDFIAYGQKDLRRPDKSDHYVLRMRADGSMESFDSKADAYKAFKASKKVAA